MRAAVVEFNFYHDEVLPTVVYVLNQLGIEPDVYTPARAIRKDAFGLTPSLRYARFLTDGTSPISRTLVSLRGTPARYRRADVLLMSSVEPATALAAAARLDLPTIAILHNADLLRNEEYSRFFSSGSRLPLFLGRHVANAIGGDDNDAWLAPVYLADAPPRDQERELTRFCVQGNVEYARRDYAALVDAVSELAAERSDFVIRMVGRSTSPDGQQFRAMIGKRGIADRFLFTGGEITHAAYLTQVGTSDWLLPLLHRQQSALAPYFSVKITSSMSMAIALGVPPIAEETLATLYAMTAASVTYASGDLAGGMRAALAMTAGERTTLASRLDMMRAELLAASVRNVASRLDRLGAGS
jgi:hypothetical protein